MTDFNFDFHYMLHGTEQETPCSCARGTVWHALLFFVVVVYMLLVDYWDISI